MKKFFMLALTLCAAWRGAAAATTALPVTDAAGTLAPARVGATRVAKWQDDKKGVFLLMFDDGWPSDWQVALPELKRRGMIGTFYIIPTKGEYKKFEKTWLTDMLAAGMVFANHTMTHDGFQGKADTEMEINGCTQYILKNVPGKNPRLISFGLPGVKDYDYGGLDFKALLARNNLIDRPPFTDHGATYHIQTLPQYLARADKAIASGDMEYLVFHGLERITPNWGYQDMWAVPQTVFLPFLDGLQERRDRGDLWITDHISWYQYQTERESAKVTVLENSAQQIRLELKSNADPQLYDLPLTLITQVPTSWKKARIVQGDKQSEAAAQNGHVQFKAVPNGGAVTLTPMALAIAEARVESPPQAVRAAIRALSQVSPQQTPNRGLTPQWEPCGWGGGGFYWAAAFHPTQDGVIYLGGDVAGVYKTVDHGRHWRLINNGLADYGVYSLAVDRMNPQTVYAATEGGLCKSTDGGEHWQLLPHTGRQELRLTGERNLSTRCVAVAPTNGNVVYAGSPSGKIYKSSDGGQSWAAVYSADGDKEPPGTLRVQFGKVNGDYYGGIWSPLTFPTGVKAETANGFGFTFKGDGTQPQDVFLTLTTTSGVTYRSKNLNTLFKDTQWRDVVLQGADFIIDPGYAKQHADAVKTLPATPPWSTVNRMDFACSGPLPTTPVVGKFSRFFYTLPARLDDNALLPQPVVAVARDFTANQAVQSYGNIRIGALQAGSVTSVAIAPKTPATVLAITQDRGLLLSQDAGQTWNAIQTPAKVLTAAFDPANARVIYVGFDGAGLGKTTDGGATWTTTSEGLGKNIAFRELVVSPTNPQDVFAIGAAGWGGSFYASHDGGKSWQNSSTMTTDPASDPTLPAENATASPLSTPTNLTINPLNPKELFISANWRSCLSQDGGQTWAERDGGADISVITDVRFSNGRAYVSVMDEGSFESDNNGQQWRQMWPLKWDPTFSGHNWRLAVTPQNGGDRVIATCSPWEAQNVPRVIVSADGGKSFKVSTSGLPDYIIQPNTMWGVGHPRALAVDPQNSQIVYLGIDGDPSPGKSGGGIFKSQDGGLTWQQLPHQPGSRRMFYGLAIDPTDSKRLFWAACGTNGGLWRSEDDGDSWKNVFAGETWPFNLMVTRDGTIYCPGQNLWRSTDHGTTWKKLTSFTGDGTIVGLEADPRDPKTLWLSLTTWDNRAHGGVYKTVDAGATWQEITGNLSYVKPQILRFNPATNELWAAGVGLFKIKQ